MTTWNWASREEWARNRRTVYADEENPNPATRAMSAYASPAEIEAAITSMKSLALEQQRAERAANLALGPLGRQRGESRRAYDRRFCAMSREDQDIVVGSAAMPHHDAREVRQILREYLLIGAVPPQHNGWYPTPLSQIVGRYKAAAKAADVKWHEEVAATPIDDAAWEQELERRRKWDDDAAHPERFIVRV
jgi:hypothetical protein